MNIENDTHAAPVDSLDKLLTQRVESVERLYQATVQAAQEAGFTVKEYKIKPAKATYFHIDVLAGDDHQTSLVASYSMAYRQHPLSMTGKHGRIFRAFCKQVQEAISAADADAG